MTDTTERFDAIVRELNDRTFSAPQEATQFVFGRIAELVRDATTKDKREDLADVLNRDVLAPALVRNTGPQVMTPTSNG